MKKKDVHTYVGLVQRSEINKDMSFPFITNQSISITGNPLSDIQYKCFTAKHFKIYFSLLVCSSTVGLLTEMQCMYWSVYAYPMAHQVSAWAPGLVTARL